jgi:hypothetical protein
MRNYSFRIFHVGIIAFIGFVIIGCGYKAAPTYVDENQVVEKKVK